MRARVGIFFTAAFLILGARASLAQECDAAFVQALKTTYHWVKESTVAESLYSAACEKARSDSSDRLDIGIPDVGNLGFDTNSKSVTEACLTKDRQFFETHHERLIVSFLPPEAFAVLEGCMKGLRFSAKETSGVISIRASYRDPADGEPRPAIVQDFRIEPDNAVTCKESPIKRSAKLWPGGVIASCSRDEDVTALITLNTDRGPKELVLKGSAVIPVAWSRTTKPHHLFRCLAFGNPIGPYKSCKAEGGCENAQAQDGMCIATYGHSVRVGPGGTSWVRDGWATRGLGGHRYQCVKNGGNVGSARNCMDETYTCKKGNAQIGMCASAHTTFDPSAKTIDTKPGVAF